MKDIDTSPAFENSPVYPSLDAFLKARPDCSEAIDWMKDFVGQPHAELGRTGAICPFLQKTLSNENARFMSINPGDGSSEAAFAAVSLLTDVFLNFAPAGDPDSAMKSLIMLVPDLPEESAPEFIKSGHALLKPFCVKRGLMIGEFFGSSLVGSVHNPELMVMQSPVPFFVLRHMSVHDLMFLNSDKYVPEQKLEFLFAYKKYVGPMLPPRPASKLEAIITDFVAKHGGIANIEALTQRVMG